MSKRAYLFFLGLVGLLTACSPEFYKIKVVPPPPDTQAALTFKRLQPALSVRGASCLMCHAQVNSNVVSDFGYGDSYFFDRGVGSGFYSDWYGTGGVTSGEGSWSSASIHGSLVVPKVNLDHSFSLVGVIDPGRLSSELSLSAVLNSERSTGDLVLPRGQIGSAPTFRPKMSQGIIPAADQSTVIEKSKIYIAAPQEQDILSLAPTLVDVGFARTVVPGLPPAADLSGLEVIDGKFVRNIPGSPLICSGDVVVKGTLFLNSVQIKTDALGCRLYVAGSVFIQGAVLFSDLATGAPLTSHNLQISSSRLVAMGFNLATLKDRLAVETSHIATLINRFQTRADAGQSPKNRHLALVAEAALISGLQDAGLADSQSAVNPMSRILVNAPEVHSRYVGDFKGAVIAELALFRLGNFDFDFDPVFEQVHVLPALKVDVLKIEE